MMIDRYSIALFLVFSHLVGLLDASAGDADPRYRKKEINFPTTRGKLLWLSARFDKKPYLFLMILTREEYEVTILMFVVKSKLLRSLKACLDETSCQGNVAQQGTISSGWNGSFWMKVEHKARRARIIAIGDMTSKNHNYCSSKLQGRTFYEYVNRIVSLYD
ncbi:post-GPI attachment to proteins factor 3-like [Gossypium australe]|uniref:Post-GPI attachment to proteins factor 3-like n=1 Tax=Gossypium australe TaxID=47621 RepID=A0A5B6WYR3_9ROSI|nr:post-GPI attachment to proteins factor 3-like [Gossypium australe]